LPKAESRNSPLPRSALRLSYLTIAWNGVVGSQALVVAFLDNSPALAGFALNTLLDCSASIVLVWRFRRESRNPAGAEQLERHAQFGVAAAMEMVALYVGFHATRGLIEGSHPEASIFGAAVAMASLIVLPWLGLFKLEVAARLASAALRGDGVLTVASAALAATTLVALIMNATLGWWWADPIVALLIAAALGIEGVRVLVRHRFG
jgi:divalent metal cation (Fe/Co/Zn/Cd) transporter